MAAVIKEETAPVPNWLLKLEEQREKRLKAKLGHEAGAGAPCQICGTKCPGLDLHFWRKLCKNCKCRKEDHDISDDDIYGFAQFTLLGSKPVKTKGILLKGSNNEVILEFTPKGSSNDVKKYLDELPEDLLPVKGSEAAKLRKQRLQKQMPAHDIDPTLCHALTDEEIKQFEEYVAFIREHSVGQGCIIRLPLFKGTQHTLNKTNAKLVSHSIPNQIASNQTVVLQTSDLSNNLQNLSIQNPDKSLVNYTPNQTQQQIIDNQNIVRTKITDVNYPIEEVEIHPLTTSNVERHQEQYEQSNLNLNNANITYNQSGNVSYIPGYVNPREELHLPVNMGLTKDLNYPVNYANPSPIKQNTFDDVNLPPINEKTHPNFNDKNSNVGIKTMQPNNLLEPVNDRQVPSFGGFIKDLNYTTSSNNPVLRTENPTNTQTSQIPVVRTENPTSTSKSQMSVLRAENPTNTPKSQMPVLRAENQINPLETHQNLTSVGLLKDLNYPMNFEDNNSNIPTPKCHECKETFQDGSVAVTAERTTYLWHPKCFNCNVCKQPLADLLYFYNKETDNIYCGRHYAIFKGIPRCAACDELIFVREYCYAENSTFHVKHFCCFECDQPLAGKSYLVENDQPICLECYENLNAYTCNDCKKIIRPHEQGLCYEDIHWHAENCFVCRKCRKPLTIKKFLFRTNNVFCTDYCYKNYCD